MLAKSRTDSVIGRTITVENNSIPARICFTTGGTPGGNMKLLKYLKKPCSRMPTTLKTTQEVSASTTGYAIREVTGNWIPGRIDMKLLNRTQKKIAVRNGTHASPSGPIVANT